MNPQEQRIADALIDRIQQRRDTIDPELAQRIHHGLQSAPDAFYLLAQAAVAQGVQLEMVLAQQNAAVPQAGWQGQPAPSQQQKPGFLESIFGPGQPSPAVPMYGQSQGYQQPPYPGTAPSAVQSSSGQPLGSAGYQAVNANLPGANATPAPQYQQPGYGQPYPGQPQYPQPGYGTNAYPGQPYPPQPGYGTTVATSGYPPQSGYGQAPYGQPGYPPPGQLGYPQAGAPGFNPSGYPAGGGGWTQPGGSMLGGMGGLVAGAAAGALVTGAVESVVHGYENHERREEEMAREEHGDRDDSWRSNHDRGLADTGADKDDGSFYNSSHDASRSEDAGQSKFADTSDDHTDDISDSSDNDSSDDDSSSGNDDASDFGGFSDDSNS